MTPPAEPTHTRIQQFAIYVAAFLLAALAPAAVVVTLSGSLEVAPLVFGIAAGHAALLGVPIFLVFRAKHWVNLASCIVAGFVIGAIAVGVLAWPLRFPALHTTGSVDGVPTIINGVPTLAGWLNYVELLVLFGAFGALSGFVFWCVLKWSGNLPGKGNDLPVEQQLATSRTSRGRSIGVAALAISLAGIVLAVPFIIKDRTCHNMFRDGRTSIDPVVDINLKIDIEDWSKLTTLVTRFALTHKLSIRNDSQDQAGVVRVLALSLCNDLGTN